MTDTLAKKKKRKFRSARKGVRAGGEEDYQSFIEATKQQKNEKNNPKQNKKRKSNSESEN
jgi:CRISPR/Cas system-associated protein Cas5 (RAMP superfamily)